MLAAGGSSQHIQTKVESAMGFLLQGLEGICALVAFICFVIVVIKMFQKDQMVMGIVCIVAFCFCGIGWLVGFIVGWMNSDKWGIKNIMLAWTVAFIVYIVLAIIGGATGAVDYQAQYKQFMPK
jgi:uncharacterized protein YacL